MGLFWVSTSVVDATEYYLYARDPNNPGVGLIRTGISASKYDSTTTSTATIGILTIEDAFTVPTDGIPSAFTLDTEWDTLAELESILSYDFSNASNLDTGTISNTLLDADLQDFAGLTAVSGGLIYGAGAGNWEIRSPGSQYTVLKMGAVYPDWYWNSSLDAADGSPVNAVQVGTLGKAFFNYGLDCVQDATFNSGFGDDDFAVNGQTTTNVLFVDASADKTILKNAFQIDTTAAAAGYVWTATDDDGNGDWNVATAGIPAEYIQDNAWSVLGTGTQTHITVTYQDGTDDVDFVVDGDLHNYTWTNVDATDLKTGSITQAYDSDLTDFAGLTAATGDVIYGAGAGNWAALTGNTTITKKYLMSQSPAPPATGAPSWTQIASSDISGLGTAATGDIGTDVQAYDSDLDDLAGLTAASGDLIYGAGAANWAKLAAGSASQIIKMVAAVPTWSWNSTLDASDGSPTGAVSVDASGNVGIGGTPNSKLDVQSTAYVPAQVYSSAIYSRILSISNAGSDAQFSCAEGSASSYSTKWSFGNDGTDDTFHINSASGPFGSSDDFILSTSGDLTLASSLRVGSASGTTAKVNVDNTSNYTASKSTISGGTEEHSVWTRVCKYEGTVAAAPTGNVLYSETMSGAASSLDVWHVRAYVVGHSTSGTNYFYQNTLDAMVTCNGTLASLQGETESENADNTVGATGMDAQWSASPSGETKVEINIFGDGSTDMSWTARVEVTRCSN